MLFKVEAAPDCSPTSQILAVKKRSSSTAPVHTELSTACIESERPQWLTAALSQLPYANATQHSAALGVCLGGAPLGVLRSMWAMLFECRNVRPRAMSRAIARPIPAPPALRFPCISERDQGFYVNSTSRCSML